MERWKNGKMERWRNGKVEWWKGVIEQNLTESDEVGPVRLKRMV